MKQVGGVAQMVERSLSMREVPGSIPGASKSLFNFFQFYVLIKNAKVLMQRNESLKDIEQRFLEKIYEYSLIIQSCK